MDLDLRAKVCCSSVIYAFNSYYTEFTILANRIPEIYF
jgi:hypothetical protein